MPDIGREPLPLLCECFEFGHLVPGLAGTESHQRLGEQLVAIPGEFLHVCQTLAGDRPESTASSRISLPVVRIRRTHHHALPRMIRCLRLVWNSVAIALCRNRRLDPRYLAASERIHLGDLDQ